MLCTALIKKHTYCFQNFNIILIIVFQYNCNLMYWKHLKVLFWRAQRFYQTAKGAGRIQSKGQGRAQGRAFDSGTGIAGRGKKRPGPTWVPEQPGRVPLTAAPGSTTKGAPGRKLPALWDLWSPFEALTLTKITPGSVLASSLILGHFPHHSEPQFFHLQNGKNNTCPNLLFRLNNWFINIMLNKESKSQNDTPFMGNVKGCKTRLFDVYKGLHSKI